MIPPSVNQLPLNGYNSTLTIFILFWFDLIIHVCLLMIRRIIMCHASQSLSCFSRAVVLEFKAKYHILYSLICCKLNRLNRLILGSVTLLFLVGLKK